jgi:UPF0755 protein
MSDLDLDVEHGRRSHRRRRRRRRSNGRVGGCVAVVVAVLILLGAGGFAYVQGRAWLEEAFAPPEDYSGDGTGTVLVEIERGQTSTQIANTLESKDVVASSEAFMDEARTEEKAALIQAGFYQMSRKMSARAALDVLINPDNLVQNAVTIPEGYTVGQTLERLAAETKISLKQLRAAAEKPGRLGLPDYAGGQLEGFLFPATYALPPNATAQSVLTKMVDRFKQAAEEHQLRRKAQAMGLTPLEAVTVASIVEAEARRDQDVGKVARVIYNRLERDMRLQMDSTVHYAVGKAGNVTTTAKDRRSRSPYNTYRVKGLPPGPIDSPGERALAAALEPAQGDWIYFVTVNIDTGETKFATTDEEHARNVEEFREFCRGSDAC